MEPSVETIKTVSGSVRLAGQYFANSVLGLIFFIFLARLVTKAELGVYAAVMFSYAFFQIVGSLGLNVAAAHFIPRFLGERSRERASGAARTIILVGFSSSVILSLVYFLLAPLLSPVLTKSYVYVDLFRATSLMVFSISFSVIMDGLLQGVREFDWLALLRLFGQVARIVVSLVLLFAGYGLIAVVIGWVIFGVCISVLSLLPILRNISLRGHPYSFRPIWLYSSPILGANLLSIVSSQVDIFLLMLYAFPAEVGGYNVAFTASSLLSALVFMSVQSTLLPTVSRAYGRGGIKAVEDVLRRASRYMALTYFPMCIGLASLSAPVVWLMAREAYQESIVPLAILASSSLAYGMGILIIIAISSIGVTKRVFEINAVSSIGGGLSCILLIPFLGMNGAALGRASLFVLMLGYGVYSAKKIMKVHFDSQALWKSLLSSALMALLLLIFQIFHTSVLSLPFYVVAGVSAYALSLKALNAVDSYDLMILRGVLPKKLTFFMKPVDKLYA